MNLKNTAVKRIQADVKEIKRHATWRYHAAPLEEDLFEWHFTIRGPVGTEFEGGVYHGRILLSPEYPFKPPNIIFLTRNGRFEVGTKICLSISAYHPEHWQPAWGVRTMLEAIISFFPTEGQGAIGALDWTPKERKKLAKESHDYVCPRCGPSASLIPTPVPKEGSDEGESKAVDNDMADRIAQMHVHNLGANSPSKDTSKAPLSMSTDEEKSEASTDPAVIASQIPDDPAGLRAWLASSQGVELVQGGRREFFEQQRQLLREDIEAEEREKAGSAVDQAIFYLLILLFGGIVYLVMKRYQLHSSQNLFSYRDL